MNTLTFNKGLKDGLPIGLGYLSVSFTFGMMAVSMGIPIFASVLISMTCVTSAGQFAGLLVMVSGGGLLELAVEQFVINLRYGLMGLSLSQKLTERAGFGHRCLMAFANTDEIFAVATSQKEQVPPRYFYGLMVLPYSGWALGTLLGATASSLLPPLVTGALGIAVYGMFLAIIVPPAKYSRAFAVVTVTAVVLSCLFAYLPVLSSVSEALSIIICAVIAAAMGALLFPVDVPAEDDPDKKEADV